MVSKDQKVELVSQLKEQLEGSTLTCVVDHSELSVAEMSSIRKSLKGSAQCKVLKNTLARRVIKDSSFAAMDQALNGPSWLIFSKDDDPTRTIKTIFQSRKSLEPKLSVKGGVLPDDGKFLDAADLERISELPPKEMILAQIAAAMTSGPTSVVSTINQLTSNIAELAVKAAEKQNNN